MTAKASEPLKKPTRAEVDREINEALALLKTIVIPEPDIDDQIEWHRRQIADLEAKR